MSRGLCYSCRTLSELASVDELERGLCAQCAARQLPSREHELAVFLFNTQPFAVGDRVACKTGAVHYDGIGVIEEVSIDPKDLATPLVPMFRVALQDKADEGVPDSIWYSEVCLSRLSNG